MRRKDRELTELADILQVIEQCRICRLAMSDAEGLYLVPMHFGYAYADGRLELYFHSAREGRKIDALRANPQVCFEMDCDMQVYAGNPEIPCTYSSRFLSVIGNGRAGIHLYRGHAAGGGRIPRSCGVVQRQAARIGLPHPGLPGNFKSQMQKRSAGALRFFV